MRIRALLLCVVSWSLDGAAAADLGRVQSGTELVSCLLLMELTNPFLHLRFFIKVHLEVDPPTVGHGGGCQMIAYVCTMPV